MNGAPGRAAGPRVGAATTALLLLLILMLSGLAPAGSHAIVLESTLVHDAMLERAPEQVMLRFNTKIGRSLTLLPALDAGVDVLRYQVLSADGHITEGALRSSLIAR